MNKIKLLLFFVSLFFLVTIISSARINAKASGTVDDFVERCYTVTLGRGSDPNGFADWKGQLLNGKAVGIHVAYGFLFSQEYTNANKSNEEYVADLYMLFMGREPDTDGFNDWVGQLYSGKSRVEVFAGFANSQEFYNICSEYGITAGRYVIGYDRNQINKVNLFVERLYVICLGRKGDIGGQKNWVEKLLNKQISGAECAHSFIFSQEYTNKGLSDDEFVENLYLAMMGRNSDINGKNNWINGLNNGKTRDEVFEGFVKSDEFNGICNSYGINRGDYSASNKGTYDPSKVLILNENNIKIFAHGFENGVFGPDFYITIENNSSKNIEVQCYDTALNGYMTDGVLSETVTAGRKSYRAIYFWQADDIGITDKSQIYEVELSFRIIDPDSYFSYWNSDIIKMSYNPSSNTITKTGTIPKNNNSYVNPNNNYNTNSNNNSYSNSNNNSTNKGNNIGTGQRTNRGYSEGRGFYYY